MVDCNATKYLMEPKTQLHKDIEGAPIDATEYRSIIGSCLRYLLNTSPDLLYVVGMASSDLASDLDGRKSTSVMAFYLNESLVSWNSQKQKTVALSCCEAKFMAAYYRNFPSVVVKMPC
ncbi:hypothetical protein Csa_021673 [Cucumis sativus]|nr:hypothetical protein Csa_021673 [Cucumis sativus]